MKYFLITGYYYPLFGASLLTHSQLSYCDTRKEAEDFFKSCHTAMFDKGLSRNRECIVFDLTKEILKTLSTNFKHTALVVLVLNNTKDKVVTSVIPIIMSGNNSNNFASRALLMPTIQQELGSDIECKIMQVILRGNND